MEPQPSGPLLRLPAPIRGMRAGECVDQLRSVADTLPRLAHRGFQHVPDAKFPPDFLHIHRTPLVHGGELAAIVIYLAVLHRAAPALIYQFF
jgi:hypothetical protein